MLSLVRPLPLAAMVWGSCGWGFVVERLRGWGGVEWGVSVGLCTCVHACVCVCVYGQERGGGREGKGCMQRFVCVRERESRREREGGRPKGVCRGEICFVLEGEERYAYT